MSTEVAERSETFAWFTSGDLVDIADRLTGADRGGPQRIVTMIVNELEARHPEISPTLEDLASQNSDVKFKAVRSRIPRGCGCAT